MFVGNSFDFRFPSSEGRVCLSDFLQQSGQRELQPLITCSLKVLGDHLSSTALSVLKSRFPALQKLPLFPLSPILPPYLDRRDSTVSLTQWGLPHDEGLSGLTQWSLPHDEGLSGLSVVELKSISEAGEMVPSGTSTNPGSTLDCPPFYVPLVTPTPDTTLVSELNVCGCVVSDDCSTPKQTSSCWSPLIFSQRAWEHFEHSLVHPGEHSLVHPGEHSLVHPGEHSRASHLTQHMEKFQGSNSCLSDDDGVSVFSTNGTSPELFSTPHSQWSHVEQSGDQFVTPCVSSKVLRRRILAPSGCHSTPQSKVDLCRGHSPDLFTP